MFGQYEFYTDTGSGQAAAWVLSERSAAQILQNTMLNLQEMVSEQ